MHSHRQGLSSSCFLSLSALSIVNFFKNFSHSSGCVVVFNCNFILLFFDDDVYWASFHVLTDHSYISFVKYLQIFCLLFFFFKISFLVSCKRSLYVFWEQVLFQLPAWKYFLLLYGLPCHFLNCFFKEQQVLILKKSSSSIFYSSMLFVPCFRNLCLTQITKISSNFSFRNIIF